MAAMRAFLVAMVASTVLAMPADILLPRQAFTPKPLTPDQQNAYLPHAHFASAAYCLQSDVKAWKCGGDCDAFPKLVDVSVGGNNQISVPWFVGYYNDSTLDLTMTGTNDGKGTIVVSHQGTAGDLANQSLPGVVGTLFSPARPQLLELTQVPLSSLVFGPGLPGDLRATLGFSTFHAASANAVLAAVQGKMAAYKTNKILVTGHSLGSAVAVLTAIQLKNILPAGTIVSTISFAGPRIGNKALADWAGKNLNKIQHINNKADVVPILPGRTATDLNQGDLLATLALQALESTALYPLGTTFVGQQGEIHINAADNKWYDCGPTVEDNESTLCSTGAVRSVSLLSIARDFTQPNPLFMGGDHGGPYDGVRMSTACTRQNPPVILSL